MVDLNDLKRAVLASRQFVHAIGAASFTLQVPTPHETELAVVRGSSGQEGVAVATSISSRLLLEQGLVGWSAVTVGDLLPGHDSAADPLEHSRDTVPLLLDAQKGWADELWTALVTRIEARNAAHEAAAKN